MNRCFHIIGCCNTQERYMVDLENHGVKLMARGDHQDYHVK